MEASAVRCAVCSYLTNVNDGALRFQDSVIDSPFTDKREKGEKQMGKTTKTTNITDTKRKQTGKKA